MGADFQDSLRTDRFYDRPTAQVEADLDAEEADLVDDLWADELAAEADAERVQAVPKATPHQARAFPPCRTEVVMVHTPEERRARAIAAERLAWERSWRGTDTPAWRLFHDAAETCAGATVGCVNDGDLAAARAFSAAWVLLEKRRARALGITSRSLGVAA